MTDNNFYEDEDEYTVDELRILDTDGESITVIEDGQVSAGTISASSITEDVLVANEVTVDNIPQRPAAEKQAPRVRIST